MSELSLENIISFMEDDEQRYNAFDDDDNNFSSNLDIPEDEDEKDKLPGDPIEEEGPNPDIPPMTPPEPKPAKEPEPKTSPSKMEDETEEGDDTENTNNEIYKSYYSLLQENDLLFPNEDFEFDGSVEGLETALVQTKANLNNAIAEAFWQKLPEDFKPLLKYALAGGNDVKKYLDTFKSKNIEDIKIEGDVENQRYVLKEYFKNTTKYSDDRIDRMIDRLHIAGELEEEATTALSELKEIEKEERDRLVQEQSRLKEEQEMQAKQFRESIASVIDTFEDVAPARKNKLKAFIFNPVKFEKEQNADTMFNRTLKNISANQEHFAQLADLIMDYDPKSGFNLERIKKKTSTSTVKSIKEKLESISGQAKTSVTGKSSKIKDSNFD